MRQNFYLTGHQSALLFLRVSGWEERLGNLMGFMARFRHGDNGDEEGRIYGFGSRGGKAKIGRGK